MWGVNVLVVAFVISATSIEARFLESLEKFLENQAKLEVNAHEAKYVSTGDGIQRALKTECTGNICRNWFQQCKKPITCAEEWCEYDKTVHAGGCEILPGTLTDAEWNALRAVQIANTIPVINDCSSCGDRLCECTYGIIRITELGKCHRIDNMLGSGGLGAGCYYHKVKPAGGYAITDDAAYQSFTDLIGKRNDERIISTRVGNWEWIDDCVGNICRHWYQQCNLITCSNEWCEFDKSIHSGCGIVDWPGTMSEELWSALKEEQKTTLPDIYECACGSPYCECNYGVIKITESVQHGGKCHLLDNKSSGCWFQSLNKILDGDKEIKMDERKGANLATKDGDYQWTDDCTGNICRTNYQQCNQITCADEWCEFDKSIHSGCEIEGWPGTMTKAEWNVLKNAQTNNLPSINECSSCGSTSCECTYGVIKITESIRGDGGKCHLIENKSSGCWFYTLKPSGKMLNYDKDKEIKLYEQTAALETKRNVFQSGTPITAELADACGYIRMNMYAWEIGRGWSSRDEVNDKYVPKPCSDPDKCFVEMGCCPLNSLKRRCLDGSPDMKCSFMGEYPSDAEVQDFTIAMGVWDFKIADRKNCAPVHSKKPQL